MREVLKVNTVYFVQEEDTEHHFHVWMFPRYNWMKDGKFGHKIGSVRPIMEYARQNMKTKTNLHKVELATQRLKKFFSK